jgi:homoserine kinase type II
MPTSSPTTSSSCRTWRGGPCLSGLIDFYFACTDLLAYDIAVCLNAWCFEPDGAFNVTKARSLIGAYSHVRPLRLAERQALPVLCRGAAIRFLLTRLYDWTHTPEGALVTRKDPLEYLRKLRFFSRAETPGDIGG